MSAAAKTSNMRRREGLKICVMARLDKGAVAAQKLHHTGTAQ